MRGMKAKSWAIALILLAGVFVAANPAFLLPGEDNKHRPAAAAIGVTLGEARYVDKIPRLHFSGHLEGETSVVVSAKIPGRIEQVLVKDGQQVEAGQTLVRLESVELGKAVRFATETADRAQAQYENALAEHRRAAALYEQKATSRQQFDSAGAHLKLAEAELAAAKTALDAAKRQFAQAVITAPASGIIINETAVVGQTVAAGQPLMSVVSINSVFAVVQIEQKDLASVKTTMSADVTLEVDKTSTYRGAVEIISPVDGTANGLFRAKIRIPNEEGRLRPGMSVKVSIITGKGERVLAVNKSAVIQEDGLYYVYIPEGRRVFRRQVEVGEVIGGLVEIRTGLQERTPVVTSNVKKLQDGGAIIVVK